MTRIAGSSQFLNQATLAAKQGSSFQAPTLLGNSGGIGGLLNVGRGLAVSGIGLSARSRALTNELLANTASSANGLFSASGGGSSTVEANQAQIRALRSSVPTSRATPEVREIVAKAVAEQNAVAADENRGSIVNELA